MRLFSKPMTKAQASCGRNDYEPGRMGKVCTNWKQEYARILFPCQNLCLFMLNRKQLSQCVYNTLWTVMCHIIVSSSIIIINVCTIILSIHVLWLLNLGFKTNIC